MRENTSARAVEFLIIHKVFVIFAKSPPSATVEGWETDLELEARRRPANNQKNAFCLERGHHTVDNPWVTHHLRS